MDGFFEVFEICNVSTVEPVFGNAFVGVFRTSRGIVEIPVQQESVVLTGSCMHTSMELFIHVLHSQTALRALAERLHTSTHDSTYH